MANQTLAPPRGAASPSPDGVPGGPRGRLRRHRRFLLALIATLVVAVVGASEFAAMLRARSDPIASDTATVGGMTINISTVEWVSFEGEDPTLQDPSASGGYAMPDSMMPDMPTNGDARLNLEVSFEDRTSQARTMNNKSEFKVGGGKGNKVYDLQGDTFGGLQRVNPGNAVVGKMFFDLPAPGPKDPPLYLQWKRGGDTVRLLLVPGGTPSQHSH